MQSPVKQENPPRSFTGYLFLYAARAAQMAQTIDFDIIHAHDWMTYQAGLAVRRATGKPLVVHVHALSFDQAGGQWVDPEKFRIEQETFQEADGIIAVSERTRQMVIDRYNVAPDKVTVIHNGVDPLSVVSTATPVLSVLKEQGARIVLFHGRITIQKGPDYFVRAAAKVLQFRPNTYFVMSGSGDLEAQICCEVSQRGISDHFMFVRGAWGEERDRLYRSADVVVMPSVSEPFGIAALESLLLNTPTIISKQSGVGEVLRHALRVDFWDTDELVNKIIAVLDHPELRRELVKNGAIEARGSTWEKAAHLCVEYYKKILRIFRL
jgi:glycosyltransferase involved in cell wall biosynthesis